MKLALVWLCLFSEAFPFPTQSPDVDATEGCCAEKPKLIYEGRDSSSGINVYVFEFLPQSNEAKDKRVEDTTVKNDLQSNRNAGTGGENGVNHEEETIPTNKPASIYGGINTPAIETRTIFSTLMPYMNIDTNNSAVSTADDIKMYKDIGLLSNDIEGHQTGMSHTKDEQKTSGYNNGDDYYGTEGSALIDIPDYNDTETGNQECTGYEEKCKNSSKSKEHTFVTQPTTHKDYPERKIDGPNGYANKEGFTTEPTKTVTPKSQTKAHANVKKKVIPKRKASGKKIQYGGEQRRKTGNRKYYTSSSSESRSDSSQEFD